APRARLHAGRSLPRPSLPNRGGPPTVAGRWSIVPVADDSPTRRAHALGETLLERYGVVTRGPVMAENVTGGFALVYRTLSGFEEMGRCRRGYFVEGLGAAQFATGGTIDRLRGLVDAGIGSDSRAESGRAADAAPRQVSTLAATDPANAYGSVLPWPELPPGVTHRPGRKAGAIVVLVDGALVLYVERGGKTVLAWDGAAPAEAGGPTAEPEEQPGPGTRGGSRRIVEPTPDLSAAAGALFGLVRDRRVAKLAVETVNGLFIIGTPFGRALQSAGFTETPKGLRA
ncbi:Lhr family helicase, partial [Cryobacterium frigoriphilum]|uniref:Lhr family helicase n=1 Tax=Cryobacterium frigoriphilum TaxID=1259150 RepID=UPI003B96A6AE